jgi:quinol monooxygenase YgiN
MAFHFIVRFEPRPGCDERFRDALLRVNGPSRQEPGCIRIDVFESLREPKLFSVYSEWIDEAAFEYHVEQAHTRAFLDETAQLLTHEVQGLRLMRIGGGPGAASVKRRITGFHLDEAESWVADLECGHAQHVRHDPPWTVREWVTTKEGRASFIGRELNCVECLR